MKSVPLCNVTTIDTRTQIFVSKPEATFNEFWPQASTVALLCGPYLWQCSLAKSCFIRNCTWWARQLVHAGDDSKHQRDLIQRDPEARSSFHFYRRQCSVPGRLEAHQDWGNCGSLGYRRSCSVALKCTHAKHGKFFLSILWWPQNRFRSILLH